jgi:ketosteroid isomerase-like protein
MDAQQNKQLVREAYALFLKGDIQGVIDRCHDDAEWASPESDYIPFAGTFRGKQGIAEFFAKLGAGTQLHH